VLPAPLCGGVRLSREISSWIIGSLLIDGLLSCSDGEEVSEKGVQTRMVLVRFATKCWVS